MENFRIPFEANYIALVFAVLAMIVGSSHLVAASLAVHLLWAISDHMDNEDE